MSDRKARSEAEMIREGLWSEVWAIVYSAVVLNPERRMVGRMKGYPSLHEEAEQEAARAHRAFLRYVRRIQ